jgi:hypothetical protein
MAAARQNEINRKLKLPGLTPTQSPANATVALLQAFEIGQSGIEETRRVWDVMESDGNSADKTRMMNYSFVCFNGLRPKSYDQTVVLIERSDLALPHFLLTKKQIFHWFEKLFKVPAITFRDQSTFDKMYQLKGEDGVAVRALFNHQVCTALERHPGLTIEGRGPQLLIFRERVVLDPLEWPRFLDEARQLAELLSSSAPKVA